MKPARKGCYNWVLVNTVTQKYITITTRSIMHRPLSTVWPHFVFQSFYLKYIINVARGFKIR